jgi:NAD(P)-dependent dehydrogenase (short-subunit alcohol dehydrogenase family)
MSLDFKRVVVVGGTSGIGQATARATAAAGAEVIVASASQSRVDRAVAESPNPVTGLVLDVTDGREVESSFAKVGELDHLVYTAGEALVLSPLDDLDVDRARAFFEVRYFGALRVVRTAAPRIREGGSVTLTAGIANARPKAGRGSRWRTPKWSSIIRTWRRLCGSVMPGQPMRALEPSCTAWVRPTAPERRSLSMAVPFLSEAVPTHAGSFGDYPLNEVGWHGY